MRKNLGKSKHRHLGEGRNLKPSKGVGEKVGAHMHAVPPPQVAHHGEALLGLEAVAIHENCLDRTDRLGPDPCPQSCEAGNKG